MKKIFLFLILSLSFSSAQAVVVGEVSRMPVSNSLSPAFRVFGQVQDFCSGTLIAPRLVLTAGHCVYDQETKQNMPVSTFSPGKNGVSQGLGAFEVERIHVPASYLAGDDRQDLAVLVLKEPVGLRTGWLNIGWDIQGFQKSPSALGGWTAPGTITGYPGDKLLGTMWNAACTFYVPNQLPLRPQYRCDTFGGMSGSALVVPGPGGESLVVGVHTQGHDGFNSGVLLSGDNKTFLQQVMALY